MAVHSVFLAVALGFVATVDAAPIQGTCWRRCQSQGWYRNVVVHSRAAENKDSESTTDKQLGWSPYPSPYGPTQQFVIPPYIPVNPYIPMYMPPPLPPCSPYSWNPSMYWCPPPPPPPPPPPFYPPGPPPYPPMPPPPPVQNCLVHRGWECACSCDSACEAHQDCCEDYYNLCDPNGVIDCSGLGSDRKFYTADLANDCSVTVTTDVPDAEKQEFCAAQANGKLYMVEATETATSKKKWITKVSWSGDCLPPNESCGTLGQNTVIGMHVHLGDAKTNGPVAAAFCGQGTPLGGLQIDTNPVTNVPACSQTSGSTYDGYVCVGPDPPCTQEPIVEPMYFNLHTSWSLSVVEGNGASRGQLMPTNSDFCS